MDKHVAVSVEERLIAWRALDLAATAAEAEARRLGQAAADPRVGDVFVRASELRQQADREFAAILRGVRLQEPGDHRGEPANESHRDLARPNDSR